MQTSTGQPKEMEEIQPKVGLNGFHLRAKKKARVMHNEVQTLWQSKSNRNQEQSTFLGALSTLWQMSLLRIENCILQFWKPV